MLWMNLIFYSLSYTFCKLSIATQYLRLFRDMSVVVTLVCKALLVVVFINGLWNILATIFACIPIERFWSQNIEGKCLKLPILWYSIAAMNIITDLAIFTTPLPVVKKLNLHQPQKIALMFVFTLGFL